MRTGVYDIERVNDDTIFLRIILLPRDRKELNGILRSHIGDSEWITVVLKRDGIEKIVVYSENDNKEYNITELYSSAEKEAILENATKLSKQILPF